MNPTLEYIYNHPKETKRIIGITYEQLIKLIAKAQIIESEKKKAIAKTEKRLIKAGGCLLYTSPSPRDISGSRMPSSA